MGAGRMDPNLVALQLLPLEPLISSHHYYILYQLLAILISHIFVIILQVFQLLASGSVRYLVWSFLLLILVSLGTSMDH